MAVFYSRDNDSETHDVLKTQLCKWNIKNSIMILLKQCTISTFKFFYEDLFDPYKKGFKKLQTAHQFQKENSIPTKSRSMLIFFSRNN